MATAPVAKAAPKVVSHSDWLAARKEFLAKEKQLTRLRDEIAEQRRQLPWEKVEKTYVFDSHSGKVTLADLFGDKSFKKRMGWNFAWVSSNATDFNYDYNVSFTREQIDNGTAGYNFGTQRFTEVEGPGASCFIKDEAGDIFHTYSSFGRGLDGMINAYNWLDIAPKAATNPT
jgi:predicted dithiol-disulfide oxidoreductase (DUF899 family)